MTPQFEKASASAKSAAARLVATYPSEDIGPNASARMHSRAEDDDAGCKAPSPLFPITFEFMQFQARCRAMGFAQRDILELAKALAERYLEAAHVA